MIQPNSELIIDYELVRNNIHIIRSKLSTAPKFMGIVKSNAYGHDLETAIKALNDSVDGFGVVRLEEAQAVRQSSLKPILMMQGVYSSDAYDSLKKDNIWTVIHSVSQLPLAKQYKDTLMFWLKVNTGMNRLGISMDELNQLEPFIKDSNVLMTHLACADKPEDGLNATQFKKFEHAWNYFGQNIQRSILNSSGTLNFPEYAHDWIRVGIGMYGGLPDFPELKTAMTFRSQILSIQSLGPSERIGYGGRIKTNRNSKIAIVYCGYADGFPQPTKDGTNVRVNNHMAPIIGRVSMDLISVDVTEIAECVIGDWCEFWSPELSINDNSTTNNLISYELMTKLSPRVKRQYLNV